MTPRVVLYGASGHTGSFVAAEIARRRWDAILAGRDLHKLNAVAARHGGHVAQANVTDVQGLNRLLTGADAVINTAGPFGDTSPPIIHAALKAGIPYFDVTAEPFVAREVFQTFAAPARKAGVVVAPAFGFFGALGDLLVTAAKRDWGVVDQVQLAFALNRWRPTNGTRLAGARRAGKRLVFTGGRFAVREPSEPPPRGTWRFAAPFGEHRMIGEFSTVDVVTLARHVQVDAIATWINEAAIADLTSPDPSGPEAADDSGRSAQHFQIEAMVTRGEEERRARLSGRDIYAITAPIVCEAVSWVLEGRTSATGALTAGELFDAPAFLQALSPNHLSIEVR